MLPPAMRCGEGALVEAEMQGPRGAADDRPGAKFCGGRTAPGTRQVTTRATVSPGGRPRHDASTADAAPYGHAKPPGGGRHPDR
jgi:hypothetical protein